MNHDEIAELLGAYALDAVDGDEAAAVAAHVNECPRCAAELAQHYEVAALLANAGSDASVELWDKIAARLDPPGEPPPAARVLDAALADALPRRLTQRQRRARWSATALIGALAATVIALLTVQVGHLNDQVGRLDRNALSSAVSAALRNPQARTVALSNPARPGAKVADIVVLPSGAGYVIDDKLRALASDQTYQLWGVEEGKTVSLGLLGSHPGQVPFSQGNGTPISAYAVTAERAGGVVSTTHSPVAEGALRSA
jgi:hypothetical protein